MYKYVLSVVFLALSFMGAGLAQADSAPTLHQVYQAAQSGHLAQADQMMTVVLQQHPDSAKAHYVDAEILAKEGQLDRARSELASARQIEPALSFANPQAVAALEARLSGMQAVQAPRQPVGFPWGLVLLGLAAIFLVFWLVRMFSSRNATFIRANPYQPGGMGGVAPNSYGPYGGAPVMPMGGGMMGGGMGSGIMSGLATGAAVGAGMVAGEELAHHFLDGNANSAPVEGVNNGNWGGSINDNMGGNDFGIGDSGSWDDGGGLGGGDFGGGGSDWT